MFRYYRKRMWRTKIISHDHANKTNAKIISKYMQRNNAMHMEPACEYTFEGIRENWDGTKDNIRVTAQSPGLPEKLDESIQETEEGSGDWGEAEVWYLPEEPRVQNLKGMPFDKSALLGDCALLILIQITVMGTMYFLRLAYRTYVGYAVMGTMMDCFVIACFWRWNKKGRKCSACWWKCVFPHTQIEVIGQPEGEEGQEIGKAGGEGENLPENQA